MTGIGGPEILVLFVVGGIVTGIIASVMWTNKGGGGGTGFALGFFLGILGVLLAALLTPTATQPHPRTMRECPHCKERMRRDASVCPHCRRESSPWRLHEGKWWAETESGWYWLDERANEWKPFEAASS